MSISETAMTFFDDLEKIAWQGLDVIDRIRHRGGVKSNVGNLSQEESGTDGNWIDGPFGISFNLQHRRVRREGYSASRASQEFVKPGIYGIPIAILVTLFMIVNRRKN